MYRNFWHPPENLSNRSEHSRKVIAMSINRVSHVLTGVLLVWLLAVLSSALAPANVAYAAWSSAHDTPGAPLASTSISGSLTGNTTWTLAGSPYLVTGDVTVPNGVTLTIDPGVQVIFNQYTALWVDGQLNASGTAGAPVVFTGSSQTAGWWRGVQVQTAGAAILGYAEVAYSGYSEFVGLLKSGSGALSVSNSTFHDMAGDGMRVAGNTGTVSLTSVTLNNNSGAGLRLSGAGPVTGQGCIFRDNGQYGILQDIGDSFAYTGNSFSGNGRAGVGINGGTRSTNMLLSPAGNPFRVTGNVTVANGATLTVEPGAQVAFDQYVGLWMDGQLSAIGTATVPITFTGSSQTAGWWRGIQVQNAGAATLDYSDVAYSGYSEGVGLLKSGSGALSVSNSSFHNVAGDGIRITAGYSSFTSVGNNFSNNNYGVRVGVNASFNDDRATFTGNAVDVFLDGGTITQPVIWHLNSAYAFYVSSDTTVGPAGRLDILPGTVVKFEQYRLLSVDGQLNASGTVTETISFTDWRDDTVGGDANHDAAATVPAAGWWRGVQVQNAGAATLNYIRLAYSGYSEFVGLLKSGSGALSVSNSTFHDMAGDGLRVANSTGNDEITRNTFTANSVGVTVLNQATNLVLTNNLIEGNTSFGVLNQSSAEVDARTNWWGHASGPAHATLNPQGQGNPVSDGVRIDSWITQLPIYTWAGSRQPWFHNTEVLTWAALGEDHVQGTVKAASVDVHVTATDGTLTVLGSGLPIDASLSWDTTTVADGWFDLRAIFRTSGGAILNETTRHVLVNNAVTWHAGTLTGNERWGPGTMHVVEATVTVPVSGTLTLDPGVTVKFVPGTGLTLMSGATLDAPATVQSPILLTSFRDDSAGGDTNLDGKTTIPLPGDWQGLIIQDTAQANVTNQVEFRYIQVGHSGTIVGNETWNPLFLHRITGDVTVPSGATLTIQPGTVVKFDAQTRLNVVGGGTLDAQGTLAQPIVFTSVNDDSMGGDTNQDGNMTTPAPGNWRDLNIEGQATLNHVILRYGGGPSTGTWSSSASLRTGGSSNVSLSNCRVERGFFDGILAQGGVLNVSNCVVTGHDRGLVAWLSGATVTVVNSTFDDNRIGLLSHGGTLNITNSIVSNSAQVCVDRDIDPPPTIRFSDLWCPASLAVRGFTDPVGSNGNISADPRYGNRDLGNYRLRFGSPAVDAADGLVAPETDTMGAPRYDDPRTGNTGTPTSGGAYADMGAYELVESAPTDVDLIVSQVDGPQSASTGDKALLQWTVVNSGTVAVRGPWHDQVMLVHNPDSRPQFTEVGQVLVGQDTVLGPGQQATFSAQVTVPPALPGNHYWQITTNVQGAIFEGSNSTNNSTRSPVPIRLDLPAMVVDGTPLTGQFDAAGASLWYQILVPANQDVQVRLTLDGGANNSTLALYAAQGRLPTTTSYDQRSDTQAGAAPILNLTGTSVDTLYCILAYASHLSAAPAAFSLSAQTVTFQIDQVSPAQGGNAGSVTLAILGNAFPETSTVRLRLADSRTLSPISFFQSSRSRIDATFNMTGIAAGTATVEVVSPTNVVQQLTNGFEILAGGSPDFWVKLVGPANLRAGRETVFELQWGNRGTVDAPVHLLDVAIPSDITLRLEPGGVAQVNRAFFFTALADGAGLTVPPGYSASRPLYISANLGNHINLNFGAVAINDPSLTTLGINWADIAPLARPTGMTDTRWNALWGQITTNLGNTWGTMLPVLANNALAFNRSSRGWTETGVSLRSALLWEVDKALQVANVAGLGFNGASQLAQTTGASITHYLGIFLQDYDDKGWLDTEDLPEVGNDRKYVNEYLDHQAQMLPYRRTELFDSMASTTDTVSTKQITTELGLIAGRAGEGETIFIHYSGHGFTNGLSTRGGVITWGALYRTLNSSKAGRIVIVMDTCHSGGFTNWLKWIETSTTAYAKPTPGRWNVIAAAGEDQTSKDGWFSKPFYQSLGKGQNYWGAFQDNANITDWRGTTFQNPEFYSSDPRFTVKDTDGSIKDGMNDGLGKTDPSPPNGSGSTGVGVVGSVDPNEKQSLGFGANGFVMGGDALNYTIFFENAPSLGATAPVQELLITDTLSTNLDWTTFELTGIGFGAEVVPVPAGHQNYRITANIAGSPYPVQVEASLDPATGLVRWYVASRDVITQDLPADPLAGFLPVNDGTGRGEGYVSFRIRPKATLADGTAISNQATITFDPTYGVNPPIVTNWVTNTLDLTPPASRAQSLGTTSPATFTVTWAGNDSGAKVAYYDVYVSVNGGTFSLWQTHTANTSASFTGTEGSTYSFYSVATDNVGHREAKTAQGETSTHVVGGMYVYLPVIVR